MAELHRASDAESAVPARALVNGESRSRGSGDRCEQEYLASDGVHQSIFLNEARDRRTSSCCKKLISEADSHASHTRRKKVQK